MNVRSLTPLLAIVLAAGCATSYRMSVPNWDRYQEGELAGFLHAPGERIASEVPEVKLRRVRGRFMSPPADWCGSRPDSLRPEPTVRVTGPGETAPADLAAIDGRVFIAELRGPNPSPTVRTVATRGAVFDFGLLPSGTYTLKATVSGSATSPGWWSRTRTVIVSDGADPGVEISVW